MNRLGFRNEILVPGALMEQEWQHPGPSHTDVVQKGSVTLYSCDPSLHLDLNVGNFLRNGIFFLQRLQ